MRRTTDFLPRLVSLVLLVLAGCDAGPAEVDSTARPVADTPAKVVQHAPGPEPVEPLPAAPDKREEDSPDVDPAAVCEFDIVWQFVDEARSRYAQCPNFPTDASLQPLSCADVEWAILESGCIPPARYLSTDRVGRVWTAGDESSRPRPKKLEWKESFCSLHFDLEAHEAVEPVWESYTAFDEQGDIICKPTDETCRRSDACRHAGHCTAKGTTCVAGSDEDCARGYDCHGRGQCTASAGKCVAASDEDCRASGRRSHFSAAPDGTCAILSDANCQKSAACLREGRCSAVDGECVAVTDDDCEKSCAKNGRCVATKGHCMPGSTEQCRQYTGTEDVVYLAGECVPASGLNCSQTDDCDGTYEPIVDDELEDDQERPVTSDGRWVVERDGVTWRNWGTQPILYWPDGKRCAGSSGCKLEGHCKKVGDYCEPTAAGCRKSKACKEEGRCSVGPDIDGHRRCVAASDEDCAGSEVCREHEACFFLKPTKDRPMSAGYPACVRKREVESDCRAPMISVAGKCRLPGTFDCSATDMCTQFGRGCETRVINDCNGQPCAEPYVECVEPLDYCGASALCSEEGKCRTARTAGAATLSEIASIAACLKRHGKDNISCVERALGIQCEVTDEGCAESTVCEKQGHCRPLEGVNTCWPGERGHCAQSEACRKYGYCGENDLSTMIECVPMQPVHCQQSEVCREEGLCVFDPHSMTCGKPTFQDASEDPCVLTDGCARYGLCTTDANAGRCVARTREDCRRSTACEVFGRCAPIDGICRPTEPSDCTESTGCTARGRCVLRHGSCRTKENADALDATCQSHELCEEGTCRAAEDRSGCAFAGDAACGQLAECREEGACAWVDGACRPSTDEHCAQSRQCEFAGNCALVDGACGATLPEHCERLSWCSRSPDPCTPENGRCVPELPNPNICALTRGCETSGRCELGFVGYHGVECGPAHDDDCRKSTDCKALGRCGAVSEYPNGGAPSVWCDVTLPEHCAKSDLCADEGLCTAVQTEQYGASLSRPPMRCVAIDDAHCAKSAACKKEGRCKAYRGACVRP